MTRYFVSKGSIPGFSHLGTGPVLIGKNNQDAFTVFPEEVTDEGIYDPDCGEPFIALVSDGLSGGDDSEVGAKIAVDTYRSTLRREFSRVETTLTAAIAKGAKLQSDPLPRAFWERLDHNALAPISTFLSALSVNDTEFRTLLRDKFLFTLLGFLHHPRFGTWVFGPKGSDGVYALNGQVKILEPQAGNKPVAPTYRFVPNEFQDKPELTQTVVHRYLPPGELESFLIGTDGVHDLIKAEGKKMPGRDEKVHPLRDFWETDEFIGEDALQLYLRQLNTESCRVVHPTEPGKRASLIRESLLLPDDTTLVFGKHCRGD